jgi:hypothetical protein
MDSATDAVSFSSGSHRSRRSRTNPGTVAETPTTAKAASTRAMSSGDINGSWTGSSLPQCYPGGGPRAGRRVALTPMLRCPDDQYLDRA